MGDRRNSIGYNSSGGFGSSNRSCYGRSPNESFTTDRSQSRHGHHPYAGNDRSDHRRQSLPGGYGNHRGGYESRRSNGYEGHRGRGNGYNAPGRGGYRGSNRGRGGGPGTGRARDDDSKTEPLSSFESSIIPLDDMRRCPFAYKKEMTARINGYEITTKNAKVVYQYCIEWSGITKKGNTVNLNTQTKAAHKLQLKQVALFTVFEQLLNANKNFFDVDEDTSKYVYDTGSIFFAHQKFLEKGETREFTIDVDDFSQEAKDYYKDLQSAIAVISFSAEINLNSLNGDLTNDRPILQYLEIAFSQDSRKFGKFFCFNNEFFEKESAEEIEGVPYVVLKNGCVRSIRLIGNPAVDKDKKLLIHLIPKKTAFYGTTSLPDFIEQTIRRRIDDVWQGSNLNTANEAIKNLTLCTTHMNHNRTFVTSGLSNDSAREHTFEVEGEILSVAEYFLRKHNIRLRYPDLPCVVERGSNYYPLEVLRIADVQKIPKAKQNKFLTSKITNKCSFDPAKNIKAIEDQSDKAEIRMSNAYIKNTGCRVDARRLRTVPAKQLYPPCIVLKDTQKILNSGLFGMQTGDKFVKPARIRLMACILASRNVGKASVEHFLNEFLNRLKLYGVEIENHQFFEWQHGGYDCEKLNDLVEKGFEYVLAIGEDDDLHHGMKFMELRTRLITQHVMPRTVENANNTLYDNLAFKFNLRAGGINWTLSSDPELIKRCGNVDILKSLMFNTMFFGIDMTHPFGTNEPTSVGFASNLDSTTACNMGDFGYLSPRETIIKPSLLASKFTAAIKAYYVKSGKYPSWIVVYRAGLSEGEIEKIQQYEIPVLKNAIAELQKSVSSFDKTQIKLTFIMSNENTNYRLFKDVIDENDKAPLQNLPPGTCVSDGIVFQKNTPSFILISQRPLKGTAHPMVYYVLDGADVVPLDHLQYLTYCLCYSNTINSPTSMCCPLESASDLSKRAKNNLNQWKRQMDHDGGKNSGAHNFSWSKENGEKNPQEDEYLDVINEQLKAVILEERFWA